MIHENDTTNKHLDLFERIIEFARDSSSRRMIRSGRYIGREDCEGYQCVVSSLNLEEYVATLLDYQRVPGMASKELCDDVIQFIDDNDLAVELSVAVLRENLQHTDCNIREIARRILDQMKNDWEASEGLRFPMQYKLASDEVLAVAVAIDSRFWSDQWVLKRPKRGLNLEGLFV